MVIGLLVSALFPVGFAEYLTPQWTLDIRNMSRHGQTKAYTISIFQASIDHSTFVTVRMYICMCMYICMYD